MFIRKTKKTDHVTKQEYYYYQLVEAYRTEQGPRQRILLNLGSNIGIDNDNDLKDLANRIEEIATGQNVLFQRSPEIERTAQKYATMLICQRLNKKNSLALESSATNEIPDFMTVDINSISNEQCRTVGGEYLVYSMFKKLGLENYLLSIGFTEQQMKLAAAIIIARAVHPASELGTYEWLQNCTALNELLKIDFEKVKLHQMYQISDIIWNKRKNIENHLENISRDLFDLDEKIIIFDITNTYFEGLAETNKKAKYGKSKEKRFDCPLVAFGLVVDKDGFPKRSETFEGNVAETKTFIDMIKRLDKGRNNCKPIVVVDAGITTNDNLAWLRSEEYPYVVVSRKKTQPFPSDIPYKIINTENGETVKITSKKNTETNETTVYCESSARLRRESRIKSRSEQKFEDELTKMNNDLPKKGKLKNYNKVLEKIGKLRERYKKVATYFNVNVEWNEDLEIATKITWIIDKSKANKKLIGTYCLQAWGIENVSETDIWKIYMVVTNVEDAFRIMKSELGLRPVYHRKEHRVDGHLFITLLAYHLINALQHILKKEGVHRSWNKIREVMGTHVRITTSMKTGDNKMLYIRNTSKPESFHIEIYSTLGISKDPLKRSKVIST